MPRSQCRQPASFIRLNTIQPNNAHLAERRSVRMNAVTHTHTHTHVESRSINGTFIFSPSVKSKPVSRLVFVTPLLRAGMLFNRFKFEMTFLSLFLRYEASLSKRRLRAFFSLFFFLFFVPGSCRRDYFEGIEQIHYRILSLYAIEQIK